MMMDFKAMIAKHNMKITGVLHVGASYGQEASLYNEVVDGPVVWIEAIPSVYEKLVENISKYSLQYAMNLCVGDEHGKTVVFNVSNNEAQSSSVLDLKEHLVCHPEVHYQDHFIAKIIRLDIAMHPWFRTNKQINFGNFDVQGYELQAIKGLGEYLDGFDYLWCEVNKKEVYEGCALIGELDEFLSEKGFERVETGQWVGDAWTDALYKRRGK
jgi:FkbM family methyltransferase